MNWTHMTGRLMQSTILALALAAAPASAVSQPAAASPAGASFTPADFVRLRWLAGDWRGSGTRGTIQAPFFERYRFVDDSTLLVDSFADSTWRTVTETARYELRGGRLGNAGAVRWVASASDSLGVDFIPAARARNSFRWERAAGSGHRPAEWLATIINPRPSQAPALHYYVMQRVR